MDRNDLETEETITTSSTAAPADVTRTTKQVVTPGLSDPLTEEIVTTSSIVAPQDVIRTTKTIVPPVGAVEPAHKVFQKKKNIFRAYQIIWYVLALIEILLAFRMVLKALGANPASGFATLIYAISDPFALPFVGILGTTVTQRSTFEWSIIIAAIVYALIAFGIVQLIHMAKPVSKQEVEQTVDSV